MIIIYITLVNIFIIKYTVDAVEIAINASRTATISSDIFKIISSANVMVL